MTVYKNPLSQTFKQFFQSERAGSVLLASFAILALILANSSVSISFLAIWQNYVGGLSLEHWVNDALMALFFLLVGLELKREMVKGELSSLKTALLPIFAAAGGIVVPAGIHYFLNAGTPTQAGIGIPMATDIVFALAALSLLGKSVPASLKVFLAALAVVDDLAAIIVIALFYTNQLSVLYLLLAVGVFLLLIVMNRILHVSKLTPYLVGGALMWFFMLQSGIHATLAGVLLAFAIPASSLTADLHSPSEILEHALHKPVAFIILPLFAFANAGVVIGADWADSLMSTNSLGIILGLAVGKPIGITIFTIAAVVLGLCRLPLGLGWRHVFGAGALAGIGFTMSIFITNLAFTGSGDVINDSKMAILAASLVSGLIGFIWLKVRGKPTSIDHDPEITDLPVK
jgi:NhaA family Na+:H+ antiporter